MTDDQLRWTERVKRAFEDLSMPIGIVLGLTIFVAQTFFGLEVHGGIIALAGSLAVGKLALSQLERKP